MIHRFHFSLRLHIPWLTVPRSGQTTAEYGVLLVLLSIAAVVTLGTIGTQAIALINQAVTAF